MTFALLFPGQGSQYIGMCRQLIEDFSDVADIFEVANTVLGFDIRSLILHGDMETLTMSENAQPAVVTASYALYSAFIQQTGAKPFCVVGHSLGEISALIAADVLSFAEGVLFARERGRIMHHAQQEKKGHAGIVVDLDISVLTQIVATIALNDYVAISGYNSPRQFIVAGHQSALAVLSKVVDEHGGDFIPFRMMPMKTDAPYHSTLMTFLQPEIEDALKDIHLGQPSFDVWSTVSGRIIRPTDDIREILLRQLVSPVYWSQALEGINQSGVKLFIDVGPQQIMRNLTRENPALPISLAFDELEDSKKIRQYFLRGLNDNSAA